MSVYADYQHFRDLFGSTVVDKDGDDCEKGSDENQQQPLDHTIINNNNNNNSSSNDPRAGNNGSRDNKAAMAGCVTSGVYSSAWVGRTVGQDVLDPDAISPEKQTLWLSTYGAHTPLHYDTYGCNLVRQLKGRKRWRLWDPTPSLSTPCPATSGGSHQRGSIDDSLPTDHDGHHRSTMRLLPLLRIPYEESSVYSTYDPLVAGGGKSGGGGGGKSGGGGGGKSGGGGGGRVIRNQAPVPLQQTMIATHNNHNHSHHNHHEDNDDEVPPDYDFVLDEGGDRTIVLKH